MGKSPRRSNATLSNLGTPICNSGVCDPNVWRRGEGTATQIPTIQEVFFGLNSGLFSNPVQKIYTFGLDT